MPVVEAVLLAVAVPDAEEGAADGLAAGEEGDADAELLGEGEDDGDVLVEGDGDGDEDLEGEADGDGDLLGFGDGDVVDWPT